MNRFEEMETFVQVVRANSLSGAAQRMAIAVSAVSRRLRQLENRLGTRLLQRSTRKLGLTEAGRTYYEQCLRILADVEEAEASLSSEQTELKGRLRIATPLSFGNRHLSSAIAAFMHLHPNLSIELDMNDHQVDLVREGFDLGIRIGSLPDSSLIARRIAPVRHVVCAAPGFFREYGVPHHPEDIRGWPALCYANLRQPEHWHYRRYHQADTGNNHLANNPHHTNVPDSNGNSGNGPSGSGLDSMGGHGNGGTGNGGTGNGGTGNGGTGIEAERGSVVVEPRVTVNNGDFLLNAAIAGLGIICEPSFIVNEAVQRGLLQVALCNYHWYDMAIHIVYPSTRHRSARVRHFVEFLLDRFGPEPYWEACWREQGYHCEHVAQ